MTTADVFIGARIRERRVTLGFTQDELGELIGVTGQQTHKYEHGITRLTPGRLYEIAGVLNTTVDYFYEGLGDETPRRVAPHQRMQLEIARNFAEIENEKHQEAFHQIVRLVAND